MKRIIIIISVSFFFIGCGTWASNAREVNLFSLKIGMSKQETIKTLDKKPDNLIGAKQYPEGLIEVVQYSVKSYMSQLTQETYWLYYLNDKLIQWGRPGDWKKEADKIYEIRQR